MPCDVRRNPLGEPVLIICSRGRRTQPRTCTGCGEPASAWVLCDGPAPARARKRTTCDRALCARCAVHVGAHFDLDFCPACASADPTAGESDCLLADVGGCAGVVEQTRTMCVGHLRAFATWLVDHRGWLDFYAKPDAEVPREQKREAFRVWLRAGHAGHP